jgi:PAS domain S-box-containing protein
MAGKGEVRATGADRRADAYGPAARAVSAEPAGASSRRADDDTDPGMREHVEHQRDTPVLAVQRADVVRLQRFLQVFAPVVAVFAVAEAVGWATTGSPALGGAALLTSLLTAFALVGLRLASAGRTSDASLVTALGILAVALGGVFIDPGFRATLVLLPVLATTLGVAYLEPARLRVVAVLAAATVIVVAIAADRLQPLSPIPAALRSALETAAVSVVGALVVLLLWHSSARLRETLDQLRERTAAAEEAEDRYRGLYESVPVGVYRADENGTITEANAVLLGMLRYPDVRSLRADGPTVLVPDARERQGWLEALGSGVMVPGYEMTVRARDGRPLRVRHTTRVSRDEAGAITSFDGVVEDVTALRESEAERRRTAEMLATLVSAAPVGIAVFDEQGRVQLWNPASERIFGWTASEVLGQPNPILPPEQAPEAERMLRHLLSGGTITDEVRTCVTRSGERIEVSFSAAGLRDADGETRGILGIATDVRERRRLEEQLRRAQKMESVGRLAGAIAHDFNNLLMAVNGYADLLLDDLPLGDPRRASAEGIRESGTRGAALTRQLLAFSRGHPQPPTVADPDAVITGLAPLLRRLMGEGTSLRTTPAPRRVGVRVDAGQLEQVLMNLVLNARDAMPRGGEVRVATYVVELDATAARRIPDLVPGTYVTLEVSDTGTGMPPEVLERIFDPFFTTKRAGEGTGLGLSTVYGIVRQSGGAVEVESQPGHGSRFRVFLPLAPLPPPVGSDGARATAEAHPPMVPSVTVPSGEHAD